MIDEFHGSLTAVNGKASGLAYRILGACINDRQTVCVPTPSYLHGALCHAIIPHAVMPLYSALSRFPTKR